MTTTHVPAGRATLTPAPTLGDLSALEALLANAARGDAVELVGQMGIEHLSTGGKRARARLALAAARALGVEQSAALHWAAAVEALHNATLIHDDVQDGDATRRGVPTTWAVHGVPQAINAGDLLLMVPVSRLIASAPVSDGVRWRLAEILTQRAEEIVRGQGADIDLLRAARSTSADATVDLVIACAVQKTGALFGACVEGAAALAGFERNGARDSAQPFRDAGVVFQWVDDIIDGFGDKGRGRVGNDVREGKVSILVADHVRLHPAERSWLFDILARPRHDTSDDMVAAVLDRIERGGALHASVARALAWAHTAEARALPALRPLVAELIDKSLAALPPSLRGDA